MSQGIVKSLKKAEKTIRRIAAVLTAAVMMSAVLPAATMVALAEGNVSEIFTDVKDGAWYTSSVQYVYDNGLMVGKGNRFGTTDPIKREEFTQILYSMSGKPEVPDDAPAPFSDVTEKSGYPKNAIVWAKETGVVAGNKDGTFGVGQPIQRQALAQMLYSYASYKKLDLTKDDDASATFRDRDEIASWATDAMNWAVTHGVLSGKGSDKMKAKLDPRGIATRAECATMIRSFVTNVGPAGDNPFEVITFGKYEQDGDEENGPEDIEWYVIHDDKENHRKLVISKYILDVKPYNTEYEVVTWESCTLRAWLNNDFKNAAFTAGEQTKIPVVNNVNEDNPKSGTPGGNNTDDQVFVLSFKEIESYFGSYNWYDSNKMEGYNQLLICDATPYAVNNKNAYVLTIDEDDYNNELKEKGYDESVIGRRAGFWWLRTSASTGKYACEVGYKGVAGASFFRYADNDREGVRPALYINY